MNCVRDQEGQLELGNCCNPVLKSRTHGMLQTPPGPNGKAGNHSHKLVDVTGSPTRGSPGASQRASGSQDRSTQFFLRGCLSLGPLVAVTFPLLLLSLTLLNDLVLWDLAFLQWRNGPSSLRLELGDLLSG
jgi:hypothetical protein